MDSCSLLCFGGVWFVFSTVALHLCKDFDAPTSHVLNTLRHHAWCSHCCTTTINPQPVVAEKGWCFLGELGTFCSQREEDFYQSKPSLSSQLAMTPPCHPAEVLSGSPLLHLLRKCKATCQHMAITARAAQQLWALLRLWGRPKEKAEAKPRWDVCSCQTDKEVFPGPSLPSRRFLPLMGPGYHLSGSFLTLFSFLGCSLEKNPNLR